MNKVLKRWLREPVPQPLCPVRQTFSTLIDMEVLFPGALG